MTYRDPEGKKQLGNGYPPVTLVLEVEAGGSGVEGPVYASVGEFW